MVRVMIWSALLGLVGGRKWAAQAVVAVAMILALWGAVSALRSDAASDALSDAYSRFNELRIEILQRDKELDDAVDQISDDCLADAALNGLRSARCPSP